MPRTEILLIRNCIHVFVISYLHLELMSEFESNLPHAMTWVFAT